MFTPPKHVTCHMSCLTSHVTCHMSQIFLWLSFFLFFFSAVDIFFGGFPKKIILGWGGPKKLGEGGLNFFYFFTISLGVASLTTGRVFATCPCGARTTIEEIILNLIVCGKEERKRTVLASSRKSTDILYPLQRKPIVLVFNKFVCVMFSFFVWFFLRCNSGFLKKTNQKCC